MPSLGTYGPHSLKLIHLTLASIWCSVENFFLGLGRCVGVIPSTPGHKLCSLTSCDRVVSGLLRRYHPLDVYELI